MGDMEDGDSDGDIHPNGGNDRTRHGLMHGNDVKSEGKDGAREIAPVFLLLLTRNRQASSAM